MLNAKLDSHGVCQGEKTRQELLNDIIARSKERKQEKARGKEEQESERERLDEGMGELLGMLNQRITKDKDSARPGHPDDYDIAMRVRKTPRQIVAHSHDACSHQALAVVVAYPYTRSIVPTAYPVV